MPGELLRGPYPPDRGVGMTDGVLEGAAIVLRGVSENWDTPLTEAQAIQLVSALGEAGVLTDPRREWELQDKVEWLERELAVPSRRPWWRFWK